MIAEYFKEFSRMFWDFMILYRICSALISFLWITNNSWRYLEIQRGSKLKNLIKYKNILTTGRGPKGAKQPPTIELFDATLVGLRNWKLK